MTRWERASHAAGVLGAVVALVALAITAFYLSKSQDTSEQALRVATDAQGVSRDALKVSKEGQALAADGVHRSLANRFYLGEAPDSVPDRGVGPEWAVINANGVDMYGVFVEGTLRGKNTVVRIWGVQACTGYLMPDHDFLPTKAHFYDGRSYWWRGPDGRLEEEGKPKWPAASGLEATTFKALVCS